MAEKELLESYKDGQLRRLMSFIGHLEALDEMLDDKVIDRGAFVDRVQTLNKQLAIEMEQLEEKVFAIHRANAAHPR